MNYVNLTAETVTVGSWKLEPSNKVAEIKKLLEPMVSALSLRGPRPWRIRGAETINLPTPQPRTIYVVSELVKAYNQDREDICTVKENRAEF